MAQQPPQKTSRLDWGSDLPEPELLQSIGKRLASGHNAASFRSVCSPWRAAVPFKSFAPLLLLPFSPESESVTFYSVSEERITSVLVPEVRGKVPCGASLGWLALMDEAASVTLVNPFTGGRVDLPPADEHIAAASCGTRVSRIDGRWVLHPDDGNGDVEDAKAINLYEMRDIFFHEIVLSAPPYAGRECVAMAVLANSTKVAFCRVGVDSAWTLLDTKLECSVHCIAHCREKFLAIDFTGDISICHCNDAGAPPTATPLPSLSPPAELCNRSYLESNGELHLVGAMVETFHGIRCFTYHVMVYKCDFLPDQTPVWSKVDDVGDLTLLVSKNFNESFSGASVSHYHRNSVYFSQALYGDQTDSTHRYEIADIATDTSTVVQFQEKMEQSEALCWFRPNIWTGGGL